MYSAVAISTSARPGQGPRGQVATWVESATQQLSSRISRSVVHRATPVPCRHRVVVIEDRAEVPISES